LARAAGMRKGGPILGSAGGLYAVTMFGHLLPQTLREVALDLDEGRSEAALRGVITELPENVRRLILHGLLRPDAILVGGYTAPGHRCCPLTSAVWEANGEETRQWDTIQTEITKLGLTPQLHNRFTAAFDTWAGLPGHTVYEADGLAVLTPVARGMLIGLIERPGAGCSGI
jgi:hypothetical protein